MSKKKLFDDDSDEDIDIKTENEYAKKYDSWREKEEVHKLEQKYGDGVLNSDGSETDSEDESDEPPDVSEEVETQFLKTLALLKTKDPRIYDPNYKCFEQEEEKKSEVKDKPKTLTFDDSDDDDDGGEIFKIEKKAEIDDDDKEKKEDSSSSPKKNKKEKKIKEYLTGKADHIDEEVEKDLAPLKALWSDPKLNEGEAFLRDYILNKRYLDEDEEGEAADRLRDDDALEADEQTVEEQSKFERAYNFRFEEPDDEYLKRFPRTIGSTRPKDDRRSRKRAEVRARKEQEKRRKMDDIQRLKALKLKDIQEKIAKIKEVTGNDQLAFEEQDIEGDFDPEEHDRRMRALFDDQYYGDADNEKPVFPDLDEELEIENWDKYDVDAEPLAQDAGDDEPHCEDEDFNMDAEYDPRRGKAALLEEIQKTLGGKRRTRKRKSKLAALLSAEKPRFVPQRDASYARYMEEYFAMDCEDVIGGDLPTRFKYRDVVPNDYGLTVEEILLADDRELTQWVPLKRIVKHRPAAVEKGEVRSYQQRAADLNLKRKLLPSLFRDLPEEPELVVPADEGSKKKKKKKKKNKEKNSEEVDEAPDQDHVPNDGDEVLQNGEEVKSEVKQKKKKKKHISSEENNENTEDSTNDVTSQENTDTPAEVRKKKKKNKNKNIELDNEDVKVAKEEKNNSFNEEVNEVKEHKSKKKHKLKQSNVDNSVNNNVEESKQINTEKKKKHRPNEFVVEEVDNQGPSQKSSLVGNSKTINNIGADGANPVKSLKRKLQTHSDSNQVNKKKKQEFANNKKDSKMGSKQKFKNKNNYKNKQSNDTSNDNPLSKLSDERLKAYGLNPKKYKNFLKYKKF